MTIDNMRQGVSKIRNHVTALVFRELNLIEQWGSGIPRILREAEKPGLPDLQMEEIGMRVRVSECWDTNHEPVILRGRCPDYWTWAFSK